jgi:hypothetical protein
MAASNPARLGSHDPGANHVDDNRTSHFGDKHCFRGGPHPGGRIRGQRMRPGVAIYKQAVA